MKEEIEAFNTAFRETIDHRQLPDAGFNSVSPLHEMPCLYAFGIVLEFSADFRNLVLEYRKLRSEALSALVSRQVVLRLVLCSIQIVANRFEFFKSHIDGAVLAAGQKQSGLSCFKVFL